MNNQISSFFSAGSLTKGTQEILCVNQISFISLFFYLSFNFFKEKKIFPPSSQFSS